MSREWQSGEPPEWRAKLHGHEVVPYNRDRVHRLLERFAERPAELYVVSGDICGQKITSWKETVAGAMRNPRITLRCDPALPPNSILSSEGAEGFPATSTEQRESPE